MVLSDYQLGKWTLDCSFNAWAFRDKDVGLRGRTGFDRIHRDPGCWSFNSLLAKETHQLENPSLEEQRSTTLINYDSFIMDANMDFVLPPLDV